METPVMPHVGRYEVNRTAVALAYRWATLLVGLLIALLAVTRPGAERVALLAPVGMALLVTWLMTRDTRPPVVGMSLLSETIVASVVIWLTGSYASPLLLYLSAPLVHAALSHSGRVLAGLLAVAIVGYLMPMLLNPVLLRPGTTIENVALLALVPLVVRLTSITSSRTANLPLDLEEEDVEIARHLVQGLTYREMSDVLSVSPETVKVSVARLYRRIGARNRGEAVTVITERNLVDPGRAES